MLDRIKSFAIKLVVLVINVGLVAGGVFAIKDQQQQKQNIQDLADNASINNNQQEVATQVKQLQKVVEQNKKIKTDAVANNPGTVTAQKPTTVTQTIPAVTKTVQLPVTVSTPAPKATTKKS